MMYHLDIHQGIHRIALAVLTVAILVIAGNTVAAQPFFTNPPCPAVKVVNNNPTCPAIIQFTTIPAAVWPATITLAPGGSVFLPNPAPGVTVTGITDVFATFVPFNPPPAPFSACGPTGWWINGISLNSSVTCSFKVCADPATCTIRLL